LGARELTEAAALPSGSSKATHGSTNHQYVERGIVRVALAVAQLCSDQPILVKEVVSLAPLSASASLDLLNAMLQLPPSSGEALLDLADALYLQQQKPSMTTPSPSKESTVVPWILPFYLNCLQSESPLVDDEVKAKILSKAVMLVSTGQEWLCRWHDGLALLLDVACELRDLEAINLLRQEALDHVTESPLLLHSLITCATLEGRPGRAMSHLRRLHASDKTIRDYHAVLQALAGLQFPPTGLGEKEIVDSPTKFLTWLMDDLRSSDIEVDVETLNWSLAGMERCCEWYGQSGEDGVEAKREACVRGAIAMVNQLSHEVKPNALTFLRLIGVAVKGHMASQAQDLLDQLESMKPGEDVMKKAFAMVVRVWAVYRCVLLLKERAVDGSSKGK